MPGSYSIRFSLLPLAALICLAGSTWAHAQQVGPTEAGALDEVFAPALPVQVPATAPARLPASNNQGRPNQRPGQAPAAPGLQRPLPPGQQLQNLRQQVRDEQEELESLPRPALQQRAQQGERGAQVALGVDFAREATLLTFAPAAGNDAISDALRWYNLAASRGFPGAPSLDQAGVRLFPVRVQR